MFIEVDVKSGFAANLPVHGDQTVGASLLAIAVGQSPSMLGVPTKSPAGWLPQGFAVGQG
ncbi:hypothetical protein C1Y11_09595 [Pseudomonas sp. FW305-20]|nr:hypothetical protein C1Y11_09595 [Pseudomonas sp. FW305-20]PMU20586.1 hypothetical protein C1Y10_06150 [Pseudomonas sp. FW305-122]PMU39970.1 hypothetical protein C1Y12_11715 [Pseudomonas sp. FW305-47B]PMX63386.1 hypothetical protein C1Y13_06645 [Pseudomonas sp. FW305-33]PMX69304.1 hypothetical protein C1X12_08960 [Pseudomonas sp. FW305-60]